MRKKLMVDAKLKEYCKEHSSEENFYTMKIYSYDYIRNYSPDTFKNVIYFNMDSCRHYILSRETKCFTAFMRASITDEIVLVTINGQLCVVDNIDVLKELINELKGGKE